MDLRGPPPDELRALESLARKDGSLPEPLERRRQTLRAQAAPLLSRVSISDDLASILGGKAPVEDWAPGLRPSWFVALGPRGYGRNLMSGAALLASLVLGGRELLSTGALPMLVFAWGVAYPFVLWAAERRTSLRRTGLPKIEPVLFGGSLFGGWALLFAAETQLRTQAAWTLANLGAAALAMALVRPAALRGSLRRLVHLGTTLGRAGLQSLDSGAGAASRYAFEVALQAASALAPDRSPNRALLDGLRLSVLLEAEGLRTRSRDFEAVALLRSRGVELDSVASERAVEGFIAEADLEPGLVFSRMGLHDLAGRASLAAHDRSRAIQAFQLAAHRAFHGDRRRQFFELLLDLGDLPSTELVDALFDEVVNEGGTAISMLRALARLPDHVLESKEVQSRLQFDLPERTVSVIEALVQGRSARELPRTFTRLADGYRRLGQRSTARRIESELNYTPERARVPLQRSANAEAPMDTSVGARPALETGDLMTALEDRFILVERLGVGATGEVFLAEDRVLARKVAVKILHPDMASELQMDTFRAEARVVASLEHPGIVRIHDAGQAGPWLYFVMEYVDGTDLGSAMVGPRPPPLSACLHYLAQISDAMAYAHGRGIIHRDLKPANILICEHGQARVTDFGIAHKTAGKDLSQVFQHTGTPAYMAPEQLTNNVAASSATDVYALGATLYYTLTGNVPFEGQPLAKLNRPHPPVPRALEVSEVLERVLLSALAAEPSDRLQHMADLARGLRACPEARRRGRKRSV